MRRCRRRVGLRALPGAVRRLMLRCRRLKEGPVRSRRAALKSLGLRWLGSPKQDVKPEEEKPPVKQEPAGDPKAGTSAGGGAAGGEGT